jgi:hypothetical protein
MKRKVFLRGKSGILLAMVLICMLALSGCSGSSYDSYASAYDKLWAKGGVDASISADIQLDGEKNHYDGSFQVDNNSNLLYCEIIGTNSTITQFFDGQYVYTDQDGSKTKYQIKGSDDANKETQSEEASQQEAPEFDSTEYLNDLASMFEVSKIKELGLFDPIPEAAVEKTTKDGDVYNLELKDSMVESFVNKIASSQSDADNSIQIDDVDNFKYSATVKDGVVTATHYSGDFTIKVPDSLTNGEGDQEYTINMSIDNTFVNPGEAVSITIPSTDDYEEVDGFPINNNPNK